MNSIIFQNDNIFFNHKEYQKRSKLNSQRNKLLKNIEVNDNIKQMSCYKKFVKENSMRNIKSINYNNIFKEIGNIKIKKIKKL